MPSLNEPDAPTTHTLEAAMDRLATRIRVPREAEIYGQGDLAERLYRIVKGVVRTTCLTADGRRLIGAFYYPGDLIGLEQGGVHRFGAEALTDCELQAVRFGAVRAYAGDAEVDRAILKATTGEVDRLQDHVVLLGRRSALERVANFLLGQAHRAGGDEIDLPMTRQDMADYLGLTIETVSRMITQLQGEAILEFPSIRRFHVRRWTALEAMAA
ncbi:helix-turn-helix domain-containing protein [Phenylobacterium immobile]|uniref:helix-turn-helix domain-containing protein n=1 Tax=Phenylobacterium immobile TaxID=21 RepID=UPI000AF27C88|nr:helix-turn-helix domain-containing protein [Phenylobacterium immobile]